MSHKKLLVIGPSSTHTSRFIGMVEKLFDEIVFLGEAGLETNHTIKQHIVSLRSKNPFVLIAARKKIRQIIANENPTLVHIQQVNRVAYMVSGILKSLKLKFVVTAWGTDVLVIPNQNFIYRRMTRAVLTRASAVTADSVDMINAIKELVPQQQTELVFFGIEPLGFSTKEKIIYSNRALFPLYRIDRVIDEFAAFVVEHKDWKLIIAGTGPCENDLKKKVQDLKLSDLVSFQGWLDAEANFTNYKRAYIYISMPGSDGTSVSLLEAMGAGCIPVLSDLPVSHEWIKNHENGIIKSSLKNSLEEALDLDQEKAVMINQHIIEERATTKTATNKFSLIYQKLIHDSANQK